jgi:hypothetical protein
MDRVSYESDEYKSKGAFLTGLDENERIANTPYVDGNTSRPKSKKDSIASAISLNPIAAIDI